MSTSITTPAFPTPDRVRIALQAAKNTETLLIALESAGAGTDRLDNLLEVLLPRLRALASITMTALDDDMVSTGQLTAQYQGWGLYISGHAEGA